MTYFTPIIDDLVGSVDGLPAELSSRAKQAGNDRDGSSRDEAAALRPFVEKRAQLFRQR